MIRLNAKMIEWNEATRPVIPTTATIQKKLLSPPCAALTDSASGAPAPERPSAPNTPPPTKKATAAKNTSDHIARIEPLGRSWDGSLVSSEASGTPSMARKNQNANGSAWRIPLKAPNGKRVLCPAAGAIFVKFDASQWPPISKTVPHNSSTTTDVTVMAEVAKTYSRMAPMPVANPPHTPIVRLANA